jgi:hypothetical protein
MTKKMKAAIVDLDGTAFDARHRLHHIDTSYGKVKDYDAFHGACNQDAVISPVRAIVQALAHDGVHILLCTGRPEHFRELTEDCLDNAAMPWDELFMRCSDDHRKAPLVKHDMLTEMISKGYQPFIAIEDQQDVVDMWRANGIHCLQTVAI